ncbi:DUF4381 family protein [Verrucomicrobiota bacterium sgz303538]
MITFFVAAIQQAPPQQPGQAPDSPQDLIRDIAPPVDVPIPAWQWALIGIGAVALLALLVWLFLRWRSQRPTAPPPTPRAIALRDLEALRPQVRTLDPYQFSIAVSDVLRTFVGGQYGLRAREQTSPEFLAEIAQAPGFTPQDKQLLAAFLERCDLIKFARVQADERVSEELLASAVAFVHGGHA